jgi:hypothetical protein
MCFSTDLDPRLFADFPSAEGDDAVLVIFDPIAFIQRALPHLNRVAPLSDKKLHQVDYYDGYHSGSHDVSPVTMKDIRFAYQREWRMILDPGGREVLAGGGGTYRRYWFDHRHCGSLCTRRQADRGHRTCELSRECIRAGLELGRIGLSVNG